MPSTIVVQKSGNRLRDPMRIQGAVLYGLEKARDTGGHLYMEEKALVKSAQLLLNEGVPVAAAQVTPQEIEGELERMIYSNVLASNQGKLYLPHLYLQECETACLVVQKLTQRVTVPAALLPTLERVKGQLGISLSKRQNEGVMMVFNHMLSIITGGPGTGKSTVLKAVIEGYRMLYPDHKIRLGAPTGKASRRMAETTGIVDAQTLRSLWGLHGDESVWQKKQQYLDVDFLVVDESSMMDMSLAYQLFQRLRPNTRVLLVGDADQLESVGPGDVFHQLIKSGLVPVTVLDEIFRQAKDSPIPYNARYIHDGMTDLCYHEEFFSFAQVNSQEEAAERICQLYLKEAADLGVEQVQILSPFRSRGDASTDRLNEKIREAVNPPAPDKPEIVRGGMTLRLHDKVMQKKNNGSILLRDRKGALVARGVFNGEVGQVHAIQQRTVIVNFDGRYAEYTMENVDQLELLLATGAHPRMVGFRGEDQFRGRGVAYCATCDGEFFTGKNVFVVGGGFAAAEESVFLTKYARHVTILIRGDDFTCAETAAEAARSHEKITVLTNTVVEEVSGDTALRSIRMRHTKTGQETEYRAAAGETFGVFVFAGYAPATELVRGLAELDEHGYVCTDRGQKTTVDGLYAAGDVCAKPLRQVVTAVGDGALAATELERLCAAMQRKTGLRPQAAAVQSPEQESSTTMDNSLFTSEMLAQLHTVFDRMAAPLRLRLCLDERPMSTELKAYMDALAAQTNKLSVEDGDPSGADHLPCVQVCRADGSWTGLAFHGVPGGHEFTSFVLGLYNAAGPGQALDEETRKAIQTMKRPVDLQVLVSLSCTMCPELVTAAQRLAAECPNITAQVYDLNHYPDLRERYQVMSVPCLVVNGGEQISFGKKNLRQLLELLIP